MIVDQRLKLFAPNWFKRISRSKSIGGLLKKSNIMRGISEQKLDLQSYPDCIVGEAYNFTDSYRTSFAYPTRKTCKKCESIAKRVTYGPKNPWLDSSKKYFQRVIREFCNHIEKVHGKKLS